MCTRFYIEISSDELKEIIEAASNSVLTDRFLKQQARPLITSGEVRPTDVAAVLAPDRNGKRAVYPMKWGFSIKGLNTPTINARTESAALKPSFREAWKLHRCAVPASWYYEWEHIMRPDGKTRAGSKYAIQPRGASMTWLCGLYRIEDHLPVFTVLTREPSEDIEKIHNRMPLILPEDLIDRWICPDTKPEELLPYALTNMVLEKT